MLKRLQNKKTARQSIIGSPVLVETTLDEGAYQEMNDAGFPPDENVEWQPQVLKAKRQQPSRTRPPRPPFESLQEPASQHAKFRPVSSIYSQPSPNLPIDRYPRESICTDGIEISPPSSPELESTMNIGNYRSRSDEMVSPIEETEEATFPPIKSRQPGRSIPVMRRERRRNEAAAHAANAQSRRAVSVTASGSVIVNEPQKTSAAPKYDPYTGEPTTDAKGRPQQVKPSAFSGGDRPVQNDRMGTRTSIVSTNLPVNQNSSTFADRIRKLREKNTSMLAEDKPAWKGASGRQALVAPPTQAPESKPYSAPRRANRRVTAPVESTRSAGLNVKVDREDVHETHAVPSFPSPFEMHPALREKKKYGEIDESQKSSDNNEDDVENENEIENNHFTESPTELQHSRVTDNPYVIPPLNFGRELFEGNNNNNNHNSRATPDHNPGDAIAISDLHDISVGVVERNFRDALKESNLTTSKYPEGQLPSKFSITTYDPSTRTTTPRPSSDSHGWTPNDAPPLPIKSSPPSPPNNRAVTTPIVNRRRPRVNSIDSAKSRASVVPARKPVPKSIDTAAASAMSMSMSMSPGGRDKNLPLTPAEKAARSQDLCVVLQAQLDSLARRRANLEKSIHQMTELMPLDGMMAGIGGAFAGGGNMRHHVVGGGGLRRGRSVMTERFTEKRREEEKLKVEELRKDLADVRIEEHQIGLRLHRAWKRRDEGAVYEPTTLWVRRITS